MTKRPRTGVPDDFQITDSLRQWFREKFGRVPERQVLLQTERFLDHHRASGKLFADWNAAWRTWMTNWRTDFGRRDPLAVVSRNGKGAQDAPRTFQAQAEDEARERLARRNADLANTHARAAAERAGLGTEVPRVVRGHDQGGSEALVPVQPARQAPDGGGHR
ncbi:MAG: hypothetical protein KGL39_06770 [Patescibacteria group bacterium]|nr:hypothetical protein [Patescibacteria group bacterium]